MATVDELQVLITANAKKFDSEIGKVQGQIKGLSDNFSKQSSKIGGTTNGILGKFTALKVGVLAAVAAIGVAIGKNMGDAVSRLDTLNNFPKVMSNLGIGAEDAQKSIQILSDKLQGLPTTLDDAAASVQRFTSANGNIAASTGMFLALNNAILAGGAGADIQRSALEQLSQAYAKGKPDMMEWRTAMMAMPAQLKQVATAMGYASSDQLGQAMRDGTVSMNQFMKTIMQLNKTGLPGFQNFETQAKNSTGGIATSIVNLKTALVRGLAEIGNAIGASNISGFFSAIAGAIGTVTNYIAAFIRIIKTAIAWVQALFGGGKKQADSMAQSTDSASASMGGVASSASDATGNINDATGAAKKLKKQLASFDEMNVLTEPEDSGGSGSSGSGGGGAPIDMDWGDFDTGLDGMTSKIDEIEKKMRETFGRIGEIIKSAFDTKAGQAFLNAMKKVGTTLWTHFNGVFNNIGKLFSMIWTDMLNTANKYGSQIDSALATLFNGLGNVWSSAINLAFAPINGLLDGVVAIFQQRGQQMTDALAQIFIPFTSSFGEIANQLSIAFDSITPLIQQGFYNVGATFTTMLADMLVAFGEWAPQMSAAFEGFSTGLITTFQQLGITVATVWEGLTSALKSTWDKYGKGISDGIAQFITNTLQIFQSLWDNWINPIIKPMLDAFLQAWESTLKPAIEKIMDFVGKLVQAGLDIYNKFIAPIVKFLIEFLAPAFTTVGSIIGGVLNTVLNTIGSVVGGIFGVLGGLIDFLTGVFTGNWSKAWEGVKSIFKNIADALGAILKAPINFIIDIINGFIDGLNKIKIPDWVPAVGGKGINIPKIPKLATGGIATNATVAMIGEAGREAVLPLENNTGWMDELAEKIGGGQPVQIVVNVGEDTLVDKIIDGINDASFKQNRSVISI